MNIFESIFCGACCWALRITRRVTLDARIALVENRRLLLVRHRNKNGWHLPGGSVAPPEFPEAAVIRQLTRLTGYLLNDQPELIGIFPDPAVVPRPSYLAVFASTNFQLAAQAESREIAEIRWFDVANLPHDVSPICHKVAGVLVD